MPEALSEPGRARGLLEFSEMMLTLSLARVKEVLFSLTRGKKEGREGQRREGGKEEEEEGEWGRRKVGQKWLVVIV